MNVIAIDFSKRKTGIFLRINGQEKSRLIKNKYNATQGQALVNINNSFKNLLNEFEIDFGLIEGYGFNLKNKRSMVPMCEVGGTIKLVFANRGIPLIEIPIQTWKMLTINFKGKKEKNLDKYLGMVSKTYGKEFKTSDEADAFMIYQAAKIIAKKNGRMTDSMRKIKEQLKTVIERN